MREFTNKAVSSLRLEEPEGVNRRLIHPPLSNLREPANTPDGTLKKRPPPEQTNAESYYYLKQMRAQTPLVVVLDSGETVEGMIEWYDKGCIKLNRSGKPNLVIMKNSIRCIYKQQNGAPGNATQVTGRKAHTS